MHHFLPQLQINMDEREGPYDHYFYTYDSNGSKILHPARFGEMRTNTRRPLAPRSVKDENASEDPTEVAAAENFAGNSSSPVDLAEQELEYFMKEATQHLEVAIIALLNYQVCLKDYLCRFINEPTESEDNTRHPGSPVYFPIGPNDEPSPSPDYSPPSPEYSNIN